MLRKLIGFIIDLVLVSVLYVLLVKILLLFTNEGGISSGSDKMNTFLSVFMGVYFLCLLAYFLFMRKTVLNGTVGRKLVKLISG